MSSQQCKVYGHSLMSTQSSGINCPKESEVVHTCHVTPQPYLLCACLHFFITTLVCWRVHVLQLWILFAENSVVGVVLCVLSITDSYLLFIRSADVAVQIYKASMVMSLFMLLNILILFTKGRVLFTTVAAHLTQVF